MITSNGEAEGAATVVRHFKGIDLHAAQGNFAGVEQIEQRVLAATMVEGEPGEVGPMQRLHDGIVHVNRDAVSM